MRNKYFHRTHIATRKFRQFLKCFALDFNAFEAHKICNISHYSSKRIYQKLRLYIVKFLLNYQVEYGEFECDESYFGPRRVRGKRGRGAAGKTPVFGILKRGGKVYVEISMVKPRGIADFFSLPLESSLLVSMVVNLWKKALFIKLCQA